MMGGVRWLFGVGMVRKSGGGCLRGGFEGA